MLNNDEKRLSKLLIKCTALLTLFVIAAAALFTPAQSSAEIIYEQPAVPEPVIVKSADSSERGLAPENIRQDGVYTILLVGNDQGNGNTDTMMLAKLDTVNHTLNVMNLPRDILINRPWEIRKLNTVYWGAENSGDSGIEALFRSVSAICGFEPDCYAVLDLDVAEAVVDALGGIRFDLPMAMDYEDASQDLYIHLAAGEQLLNGEEFLWVCRYRSGYPDADLGRINMQQQLLKAAAEQFISLGNLPNIGRLLKTLSDGLVTDLSRANLAYFASQLLHLKSEDINFFTAPNEPLEAGGYSYAVLKPYELLEMINTHISPLTRPVELSDLDIVYFENGQFRAANELADPSYYLRGHYIAPVEISAPEIKETPRPTFAAPEE